MGTELTYLYDTYCFESNAIVKSKGCDDRGTFVIFDKTNFYPQGGGQMHDQGVIIRHGSPDTRTIPVIYVGFRDGEVMHYIPELFQDLIEPGCSFYLSIDGHRRLQNAMLHTAGHLISHIVETIEPRLIPIKGYHFIDGPYVEFINNDSIDVANIRDQANNCIIEEIAKANDIKASYSDLRIIEAIRPHLAPFVPKDKPTRVVTIGNFVPLPCGGTHLVNLKEVGGVRVTKTKRAKGNTRVSYEVL
jgi:Ser-tRNA(Ala) deacylase AlaX